MTRSSRLFSSFDMYKLKHCLNFLSSMLATCSAKHSPLDFITVLISYEDILLSITNKMQRYTIFFIAVNAVHVSGSFSAHHQELKTVHTGSGCLLAATASVGELALPLHPL